MTYQNICQLEAMMCQNGRNLFDYYVLLIDNCFFGDQDFWNIVCSTTLL